MYSETAAEYGTDSYIHYVLDTYSQTLIRLCYTYVHNICDAEDITQDVLVALLKRGRPFDSPEHEKAWLLRTAMNKSKNHLRSGWVKRTARHRGYASCTRTESAERNDDRRFW